MKISELIKYLEEEKEQHGDIDVISEVEPYQGLEDDIHPESYVVDRIFREVNDITKGKYLKLSLNTVL